MWDISWREVDQLVEDWLFACKFVGDAKCSSPIAITLSQTKPCPSLYKSCRLWHCIHVICMHLPTEPEVIVTVSDHLFFFFSHLFYSVKVLPLDLWIDENHTLIQPTIQVLKNHKCVLKNQCIQRTSICANVNDWAQKLLRAASSKAMQHH